MPRFTLYNSDSTGGDDVREKVQAAGGKVIAAQPGLALVDATEQVAVKLRKALPGWRITGETKANISPPRPKVP